MFPYEIEGGAPGVGTPGIFVALLPNLEQGNMYSVIASPSGALSGTIPTTGINTYICPGRRSPTSVSLPKTDYGFSRMSSLSTGNGLAAGYHNILGNKGVTMTAVTNGAGTSNTLLLAHKIMSPSNYFNTSGDSPWDIGFIAGYGASDHMRFTDDGANQSGNLHCGYCQDSSPLDENHMGGPHTSGSPVLWGDGSVRLYTYRYVPPGAIGNGGTDATAFPDNYYFQLYWCFDRPDSFGAP
jgi:prepilin-type processing-associated H-X9-DG protein